MTPVAQFHRAAYDAVDSSMLKCHLILLEKNGQWATALRAVRPLTPVEVVETRSLRAVHEALVSAPASVVALHVTADNVASVIDFLLTAAQRFPRARFAGLLEVADGPWDPVLREAGAIDVIHSVLDLPRLSRLADRQAELTPLSEPSMAEWVASRMPWKAPLPTIQN
jgi:hypothetical protein